VVQREVLLDGEKSKRRWVEDESDGVVESGEKRSGTCDMQMDRRV
jgi:hypothetical protein